jgi:hypothetical protein
LGKNWQRRRRRGRGYLGAEEGKGSSCKVEEVATAGGERRRDEVAAGRRRA